MDKIGMYRGKAISEMTREELLDFAVWAGKRITELQNIADDPERMKEVFKKETLKALAEK